MAQIMSEEEAAGRIIAIMVKHFGCREGEVLRFQNFMSTSDQMT